MALTFNIYTIVVFSYGSNSPLLKIDQRSAIIILNKCSISNAHKKRKNLPRTNLSAEQSPSKICKQTKQHAKQ